MEAGEEVGSAEADVEVEGLAAAGKEGMGWEAVAGVGTAKEEAGWAEAGREAVEEAERVEVGSVEEAPAAVEGEVAGSAAEG